MTIARRLTALEAGAARRDAHAVAARIAATDGIPVAELLREAERVAARCATIGMDACLEEIGAATGITIATLRAGLGVIERRTGTP